MPVEVRPASFADAGGRRHVTDVVAKERRTFAVVEAQSAEDMERFYRESIVEMRKPFFVACEGERVIGYCEIDPSQEPAHRHVGWLDVAILPEYRGRGIGRQLVSAGIVGARDFGLELLSLATFSDNIRAIRLYESLGFRRDGLRRNTWKLDGRYQDTVLMTRVL